MTIARACRPPAQAFCRRLAGRWWIAQHPPSSQENQTGTIKGLDRWYTCGYPTNMNTL